ncbi:MAG TPA: hypothetical protein PKC87_00250 [Candidatus Absconditabacterales bacterium]|nr:hypothetical protein [Candidatus Absconditabacterales bacterium]
MQELKGIQCPKSGFKLESEFTTWWLGELKKKGFWKKKWSDGSREQKPYDCNIRTNLDSYHVEIKIIKKDEFSFDKFQPNQIKALQEISDLGGKAIVVIYSIEFNSYIVEEFSELKKRYLKKV